MVTFLFKFFLPHETNNFRSKGLHLSTFLLYIFILLAFQLSFRVIKFSHPEILGFATDINVEKLVNLTNAQRIEAGFFPLKLDINLSYAAKLKAEDMFARNYWAHSAPDGKTPWFFITESGYKYIFAGENLARDFNDSETVVKAWLNSPSHRENILKKEYQDIGFAVVNGRLNGEETTLVVEMLATPAPSIGAERSVIIPPVSAASVITSRSNFKSPTINFFQSSKNLATLTTMILLGVLILDGLYIWRKKIIRITSHNLAHIILLISVLSVLWVTSQGAIL